MRNHKLGEKGFSLISLIAVLAVILYLYFGYFGGGSEPSPGVAATKTARAGQEVACLMNRQAAERAITTWILSHPGQEPTLPDLERDGVYVSSCPQGGRFSLQANKVLCSVHPEK